MAFQRDAFQNEAFQVEIPIPISVFGGSGGGGGASLGPSPSYAPALEAKQNAADAMRDLARSVWQVELEKEAPDYLREEDLGSAKPWKEKDLSPGLENIFNSFRETLHLDKRQQRLVFDALNEAWEEGERKSEHLIGLALEELGDLDAEEASEAKQAIRLQLKKKQLSFEMPGETQNLSPTWQPYQVALLVGIGSLGAYAIGILAYELYRARSGDLATQLEQHAEPERS